MENADLDAPVTSPCINICAIDRPSGLCKGCLRTIAEIRDWRRMSSGEQRSLVAALAGRSLPGKSD